MANFDALARQARSTQAEAAVNELFFELFALETWCFLHDPETVEQPLILELSDGTSLLPAFTDAERAQRWAEQSDFYTPDSESPVMIISVTYCLMWIWGGGLAEADRVSSLCFNLDAENFLLPLEAIQQMTIELLPDRPAEETASHHPDGETASHRLWRCKGGITPTFLGSPKSLAELNSAKATGI